MGSSTTDLVVLHRSFFVQGAGVLDEAEDASKDDLEKDDTSHCAEKFHLCFGAGLAKIIYEEKQERCFSSEMGQLIGAEQMAELSLGREVRREQKSL